MDVHSPLSASVPTLRYVADEGIECLNVVARCEYEGGEPAVQEPEEAEDVFWLPYGELLAHPHVPEFVSAFAELVEDSR